MSVAEGGTTAVATANATTVTSASITPTANTLMVALVAMGNGAGSASSLGAVTDSVAGTWTRKAGEASATGGVAEVWMKDAGASPSAQTVTYDPGGAGASGLIIVVKYYTGAVALASQTGATAVNGGTTAFSKAVVTTTAGSLVVGAHGRASDASVLTALAGTTIIGQFNGTSGDTAGLYVASAVTGTPGSTTFGASNVASGVNRQAFVEILPSTAATAPPPRPSFYRRTSHLMTR
jgi:hypothetical protein